VFLFFFQAEDGIRDLIVTGVQTCALPISPGSEVPPRPDLRPRRDRRRRCWWGRRGRGNRRGRPARRFSAARRRSALASGPGWTRSEEHTSELQSRSDLVCRLLLEKKKKKE